MTAIPPRIREALKERSSGLCERCGQHPGTNAHHRKNRSQGGQNTLSNLMWICGTGTTKCHGVITQNPRSSAESGYTVWSYETPAEKPVNLWHHGRRQFVWLEDDGGIRYQESGLDEFHHSTSHNPEATA